MPTITITRYGTWRDYNFRVADPDKLTQLEVNRICNKMGTDRMMVNGNFYKCSRPKNWRKHTIKNDLPKGIKYRKERK